MPPEDPRSAGRRPTGPDESAEAHPTGHPRRAVDAAERLRTAQGPTALGLLGRVPYGRMVTSLRAMPFVAPARHVVSQGCVLLRVHAGLGCHQACCGSVVAYGADNLNSGEAALWSAQVTGTAELAEPTAAELQRFGGCPQHMDGEPFEPVYLRIRPRFGTLHIQDCPEERHARHAA